MAEIAWELRESEPERAAEISRTALIEHERHIAAELERDHVFLEWQEWDHREWLTCLGIALAMSCKEVDLPNWVRTRCHEFAVKCLGRRGGLQRIQLRGSRCPAPVPRRPPRDSDTEGTRAPCRSCCGPRSCRNTLGPLQFCCKPSPQWCRRAGRGGIRGSLRRRIWCADRHVVVGPGARPPAPATTSYGRWSTSVTRKTAARAAMMLPTTTSFVDELVRIASDRFGDGSEFNLDSPALLGFALAPPQAQPTRPKRPPRPYLLCR